MKVKKRKAKISPNVKIKTTSEKITSRSGLLLAEEFIRRLFAREILDDCLSVKKRKRGYPESEFIINSALAILDGASCLSDIDRFREDKETQELLNIKGVPHSTTIGEFLEKYSLGHIRQLEKALREISSGLHEIHPASDITVDVDSISLEKHGSQEGVSKTYTKKKGLHPQFAFRDDTNECVFARLQRGSAYSASKYSMMLKSIIKALPDNVQTIRFRADAAWYSIDFLEKCESMGNVYYYITAEKRGPLMKKVHAIPEYSWLPYSDHEQVADLQYGIMKGEPRRFIVKRKEVEPKGKQMVMDFAKYQYHIIVTNDKEKSPKDGMNHSTGRGNVENRLKEMVYGLSLNKLPCHRFMANWAYMLIIVLANNLGAWMRSYALPERHKKITFKTLRYRFLHVAGRLCQGGH